MTTKVITLDDRYSATEGRVFMSGLQALVRLPMAQMRRDRAAGLNTGALISGYRGSPLGGYDQQVLAAREHLEPLDIHFQVGVNEDLAAAALWGTQQLHLSPGARKQGVVGFWYGKGPGVDRSGDVLKHANAAGTSAHGGVLCFAGDDHAAKSSSIPHQSDHAFMAALMPVLYPSSIHEFLEMGLLGVAMSRYSGCWVGMKFISDTVETTASVDLAGERRQFVLPTDFEMPAGGLNLRWPDPPMVQDDRLQNYKGYAAIAFARANKADQVVLDAPNARFGIVASGKAYEDVLQALRELEIGPEEVKAIGLRLYKVRMPWPLEPEGIRHFSEGLEEVLVVEERREIIENQIKQQLFNWRADVRPRIIGKLDDKDHHVLPLSEMLTVGAVARAIAGRLLQFGFDASLKAKIAVELDYLEKRHALTQHHVAPLLRTPYYCSGCPHNTSTRVPEGSRAAAGIGCHYMVQWMDRRTETFSHMGGEGVPWTGMSHFTDEKHMFVNVGDGTYFHSGILAIRQAVSSGANVTYKLLYNDAVAMTGGQRVDEHLTPQRVTHQLHQEGVKPIYFLTDKPEAYDAGELAPGVILKHRDFIDAVMEEVREAPGCSAIVYEQTCAAELRRRRKRGFAVEPEKRVYVEPSVCEGCGDCSVQSNCISIEPLETEFGRKRLINQSSCNKDYSCLKGFCPSFVTVQGGALLKRAPLAAFDATQLPDPEVPELTAKPWNIAITGVGGSGVLTIGALLGMAAHVDGKGAMVLDMAGLAQKGGAVLSHIRLGARPEDVSSPRIVTGGADLLLAADDVVAVSKEGAQLCDPARTHGVVNTHLAPIADFVRHRDLDFKTVEVEAALRRQLRSDEHFVDFSAIAEAVAGNAVATNVLMLGYAWQRGLVPLSRESIAEAIRLNKVAVNANLAAFDWGRRVAADPASVQAAIAGPARSPVLDDMSLEQLIAHRAQHLEAYQDAALARKYRDTVARVRKLADENVARAVAHTYARLLAYKDEYEVARLYTRPEFLAGLKAQFDGDYRIEFNLAPPFLPGKAANGRPQKRTFGRWMLPVFRLLASMRHLRGTPFDVFGFSHDRKLERSLIGEYEALLEQVLAGFDGRNSKPAAQLLGLHDQIRGYGPVKAQAADKVRATAATLLQAYRSPSPVPALAAE
jgi:indolepyruvate ferredoxin oxidoreductase